MFLPCFDIRYAFSEYTPTTKRSLFVFVIIFVKTEGRYLAFIMSRNAHMYKDKDGKGYD